MGSAQQVNSLPDLSLRLPPTESDHALGPADAKIVVLMYGDYECPASAQAHEALDRLRQNLKRDLRLVFRNFLLETIHPRARDAARAAEAAGLQGKFWDMNYTLFENQDSLDPSSLNDYAADLNLDMERFTRDLSSLAVHERIAKDLRGAAQNQIVSSPTLFINGARLQAEANYATILDAVTETAKSIQELRRL